MGLLNTTYIYWKTFTNHPFLSVTPLKPLPTPYFRVLIYFRGSIYFWYLFFLRGVGEREQLVLHSTSHGGTKPPKGFSPVSAPPACEGDGEGEAATRSQGLETSALSGVTGRNFAAIGTWGGSAQPGPPAVKVHDPLGPFSFCLSPGSHPAAWVLAPSRPSHPGSPKELRNVPRAPPGRCWGDAPVFTRRTRGDLN